VIREAVLRSIVDSFAHVRLFQSLHGRGLHILCSDRPIAVPDADEFLARLPEAALEDLMEYAPPGASARRFVQRQILDKEVPLASLLTSRTGVAITDDRPINEYFALRRLLSPTEP
jgi:hypothetical protein